MIKALFFILPIFGLDPHTIKHLDMIIYEANESLALTGEEREKLKQGKGLGQENKYINFWTKVRDAAQEAKDTGVLPEGVTEENIAEVHDLIEERSK